jgi:hypothetical protein
MCTVNYSKLTNLSSGEVKRENDALLIHHVHKSIQLLGVASQFQVNCSKLTNLGSGEVKKMIFVDSLHPQAANKVNP